MGWDAYAWDVALESSFRAFKCLSDRVNMAPMAEQSQADVSLGPSSLLSPKRLKPVQPNFVTDYRRNSRQIKNVPIIIQATFPSQAP